MPYVCNGRIDGFRSLMESQKRKGCYNIYHCWCNHNYIRTWEHFVFLHIQGTMTEEQKQQTRERIGQRVKALRLLADLSQDELAQRAGLQRTHIGRIEGGKYAVTLETIQAIAEALGMTVDIIDPGLQDLAPLKRLT